MIIMDSKVYKLIRAQAQSKLTILQLVQMLIRKLLRDKAIILSTNWIPRC